MEFHKSRLTSLAMLVALLVTASIGYWYSPLLLPRADVTGIAEPGCDLRHRSCPATWPGGGSIELSITPRPIPFLEPLRIEVQVNGIRPDKVEIDFAGATMNMGYNRSELVTKAPGLHVGEASLPVCVSGRMTWVATVVIESDRQRIAVPFRFEVGH